MQLFVGENIKRLRKEKGITQEKLAQRLHVSCVAISKWERGETMPDIGMVIPLASFFGVSTDEILGFDSAKNEERIQGILNENNRLKALGKEYESFELITKAYSEFPHDWRIIGEYMWQLTYDPNCSDKDGSKVHKDELYSLCKLVLDECTVEKVRYSALSILGGLYILDGKLDKAIETAKRFPNYYMTQEQELENCFERGTAQWWTELRKNIQIYAEELYIKIRNAALYTGDTNEQLRILKKALMLTELLFDDGDYGFFHYHLSDLHRWIARCCMENENYNEALESFEKGLSHAKAYDDLPKTSVHTSFLLRDNIQDMTNISSGTEFNKVAEDIDCLLESPAYEKGRDMPQFRELIEKYKPFMGKKKDYFDSP